jgi:hypothetical protein
LLLLFVNGGDFVKKIVALFAALCLILLLFCAHVAAADAPGMLRYSNPTYKIEMLYPANWQVTENFMGTVVIMASYDPAESFHNNLNVIIASMPPGTTLEQLSRGALNVVQRGTSDFELLERSSCKMANMPAEKIAFTGSQGIYHLCWTQYYTLIDGKAYIITFTSDDANRIPAGVMQKIVDSFQVKGAKSPITEL